MPLKNPLAKVENGTVFPTAATSPPAPTAHEASAIRGPTASAADLHPVRLPRFSRWTPWPQCVADGRDRRRPHWALGLPWRSPGRYAGDFNCSVGVSLLVAALAHAGGEGAAIELRRREEQGRAPAERLLELQPSNGRGHPARVGIRDELRPVDVRPFPRSRTARREHDEEQNEDTHLHETLLL